MESDIFKNKWKRGRNNRPKRRLVELTDYDPDRINGKHRELLELIDEEEYDYYPRKPRRR